MLSVCHQKADSSILEAAHAINNGQMPVYGDLSSDFAVIECPVSQLPGCLSNEEG
jgi:hypothetical protein